MTTLLGKQSIEFLFYGYDWNDPANSLINLKSADGAQNCLKIPKRTGADSWEHDRTTGPDELHFFNPKCGQHGRSANEEEPIVVIIPDESCFNYGEGITWEVSTATNETAIDGAILLHVEGGIEPYRYEWWNGVTTNQVAGLAPGNYCVRIYDALCCETQVCIEIPVCQNAKLSAQITKTCEGQQNGAIDLNLEGASGVYTFLWSNGVTTQDLSNLSIGTYCVTVTSSDGCSTHKCYNVLGELEVVLDEFILDTQKLSPGMYMVVFAYDNGTRRVEKVIRI